VTQNKNIAVDNTFKIYLRQYESDIIAIGNWIIENVHFSFLFIKNFYRIWAIQS
jgi:hypothetical protein